MTILPTAKPKKTYRKEEKPDWNASHSGSSSRPSSSVSRDHSSLPSGPPRKVPRKVGLVPTPVSRSPPSSLASPRSRDEKQCASTSSGREEGANSDDEYDKGFRDEEMERLFEERLFKERGLQIKKMVGDGACLFRAVAEQIYGDEGMHGEVRKLCLDHMEKDKEHFAQFITEDFNAYIARKRRPNEHGNHPELQSISEIYNRPIEIYQYNIEPINVFHPKCPSPSSPSPSPSLPSSSQHDLNPPLRLSYHGSTHYNAVIDPTSATVGVGLGLPSFQPGLADRQLIEEAIAKSELAEIEKAMLNDKMKMSDWQRTEEDMKDQVARDSYLEYLKSLEKKKEERNNEGKSNNMLSRPSSSSHFDPFDDPDQPSTSQAVSTRRPGASSLYEELLMAEALDWNDAMQEDSSLAEALLLSQQTYLSEYQTRRPDSDGAGSSKH